MLVFSPQLSFLLLLLLLLLPAKSDRAWFEYSCDAKAYDGGWNGIGMGKNAGGGLDDRAAVTTAKEEGAKGRIMSVRKMCCASPWASIRHVTI